ncbi:MAG TPA: BlaI/MecI/CopY family transcriptional regulator [Polyangia bacterium]|nr:BlaI/MecI/CopY family transcriptional regulator [Polyangia bacterium]
MGRERSLPGGKLEYAVLVALWEGGAVTVRELHERVGEPLGLVYTTTARVVDRLYAKRLVERVKKEGKAFFYRASAARQEVERARLARTLTSVLAEGPRPALATLVEVIDEIDPGLLDELTTTIDALRRSRREP